MCGWFAETVTDPENIGNIRLIVQMQSKKKEVIIGHDDAFLFCPQIRWTKTAGSVSDRFQDSSVFNETLHIAKILRTQGGRYYCKAENGLGSPAIKSIRVDVYCECMTRRTSTHWWFRSCNDTNCTDTITVVPSLTTGRRSLKESEE